MSYAVSAALQQAVYQRLAGDAALTALVGDAIFDARPPGPVPDIYVALGPEKVRDASDQTGHGARHEFTVSVVAAARGFAAAKTAAAAISDALVDADLTLARGRVVFLRFLRAAATRSGKGETRRIDLIFRAGVEDA